MDDNAKRAAVMGAAVCVISVGRILLDDIRYRSFIPREPHVNQAYEREMYTNSILYGANHNCVKQIRMRPSVFFELCKILGEKNLLRESVNMSIKEQVLMFLHIIGHNVRFRVVGKRFHRSIETVHRYFRVVLKAVLLLHKFVVRQPGDSTPPKIRNDTQFYPYFKDCVGAIGGIHVRASVPLEIQERFRNQKEETTQNVLAAITFDLKFTYVLAGWEGTAHDSHVLNDALSRPGRFMIPKGKYYLGGDGYRNRNGILSPYRAIRYELKEFSDRPPENEKELYNFRHSSLRTIIERGFRILKKRFRVLDVDSHWSFQTQVDVLLACCIIHNFIMGVDSIDSIIEDVSSEAQSQNGNCRVQQTCREKREESKEWNMKRDEIAQVMWEDYTSRRNL